MPNLPEDALTRMLAGILAGLALGVVVMEAFLAGMTLLLPAFDPEGLFDPAAGPGWYPGWCLAWLLAGAAGGSMATGVARRWPAGVLSGILLATAAILHAALSPLPDFLVIVLALLPLAGAVVGTRLAARLLARDRMDDRTRMADQART